MSADYKTKAALKLETAAYGNPIALGANTLIHMIVQDLIGGTSFDFFPVFAANKPLAFNLLQSGAVEIQLYYSETFIMALPLGVSHPSNSPVSLGGGRYRHYLEPDQLGIGDREITLWDKSTASGDFVRRVTLCFDIDFDIWEYLSCYFSRLTFNIAPGNLKALVEVHSPQVDNNSFYNYSSSSWTFPSTDPAITFDQCIISLWARDIFTLASSKTLYLDEGSGFYNIIIASGTYLASELAREMSFNLNVLSAALNDQSYRVIWDWQNRKFIITASGPFKIGSSGTINPLIGFEASTDYANVHTSKFVAKCDDTAPRTSGDYTNVVSLTIDVQNNLIPRVDSISGDMPKIISDGIFTVSGEITFPRYDETLVEKLSGLDPLCLKVTATSDDTNSNLDIYLPEVILSGNAGIGNGKTEPGATLTAYSPGFVDTDNIFKGEYHIRNFNVNTHQVISVGSYDDILYMGTSAAKLLRIDDNGKTITDISGAIVGNPQAFQTFRGELWIGCSNGRIYRWDGSTLTLDTSSIGAAAVVDMCVADGYLFIMKSDADVYRTDYGTTYSNVLSGSGTGHKIIAYDGYVYALFNGDIHRGLATGSFSSHYDFTNTPTYMAACIHGNVLWAFSDDQGAYSTGDSFTGVEALSQTIVHCESFMGHIILIGTSQLYRYNLADENEETLYTSFSKTPNKKPLVYQRRLLIPVTTTGELKYIDPPKEIMIVNTNTISSNPLL